MRRIILARCSRLAALSPTPRVNLTRYHGMFARNINHRALVSSKSLNVRFEVTGTSSVFASFLSAVGRTTKPLPR